MRIKDGIEEYLVDIEIRNYTHRTIRSYRIKLDIFRRWCESEDIEDTEDIRLPVIKKYTQSMLQRGCKASYVNGTLKTLKSFVNYLYEEGEGGFNTKNGKWRYVKEERTVIQAFSPKQIKQLLAGCQPCKSYKDYRDLLAIVLFLETGIRVMELIGIKKEDIHDDYILIRGKNRKERPVALTPVCKKHMLKYDRVKENYFAFRPVDDNYFLSVTGRALTNSAVEYMIKTRGRLIENDGSLRVSAHTLRHTYATRQVIMSNMDIYTLQRSLGHQSISVTERYISSLGNDEVIKKAKSSSVLLNL